MLFRTSEGVIIEIMRSSYNTDTEYYKEIMKVKGYTISTKEHQSMKRIMDTILKKK